MVGAVMTFLHCVCVGGGLGALRSEAWNNL